VGAVNAVSFSPDGNFFSSGGADQLVMVWKSNLLGLEPDFWEKEKMKNESPVI
jgi:WD40 repeat protein